MAGLQARAHGYVFSKFEVERIFSNFFLTASSFFLTFRNIANNPVKSTIAPFYWLTRPGGHKRAKTGETSRSSQ